MALSPEGHPQGRQHRPLRHEKLRIELPEDYTVFPNLANGQIHLSLSASAGKEALVQLVNGQGVVVEEHRIDAMPTTPLTFDLAGFMDGIYWLNVQVEGKRSRAMRFVVAH